MTCSLCRVSLFRRCYLHRAAHHALGAYVMRGVFWGVVACLAVIGTSWLGQLIGRLISPLVTGP